MQILVACPKKLLLVETDSGNISLVESHRPEYYGISWSEDGQELCLGHSGVENSTLSSIESYMDSERGWISIGEREGPAALSATHQVLCVRDRIVATNTGRNCITVFRTDDMFYRHYWFDDVLWDRKGTKNRCGRHLNSLFLKDESLWIVAHNHDRGSELLQCSWPDMKLVDVQPTMALMAHNIWITDEGQRILCDSMRASVCDAQSGDVLWKSPDENVVTRGLAAHRDQVFVGQSKIGKREERVHRESRIWVVDRKSWRTLDSISLPGSGNLHELRIVDQPDLCHHGQPFLGQLAAHRYLPAKAA